MGGISNSKLRHKSRSREIGMKNTEFKFDPMITVWEFGYWDKGWDEPDCKQHWSGASSFEPWGIEKALDRATELGFLSASDREKVRIACLTDGEYFFGSESTSGWMIGQNEDFTCVSPYPYEPIWMMVKIPGGNIYHCDWSETVCPILSSLEVEDLNESNRIIHRNLTLPEILKIFLLEGETNPKYQDVCLQCLYAATAEQSYVYYLSSKQWIQICRQFTAEEEAEFMSKKNNKLF
jgi:hypothetical protein